MADKVWKVHALGGGAWNRPRLFGIAAPTTRGKHDPLQQRYSMFWSPPTEELLEKEDDRHTKAQRRQLGQWARIPGKTLWLFEREDLVADWSSLVRDRGHASPLPIPRPYRDARFEGIMGVYVPRAALRRNTSDRIVSIPEDMLPELTQKLHANVFRIRELRRDQRWRVWILGEYVPCPQWNDVPGPGRL
jgi:hypothetical protein